MTAPLPRILAIMGSGETAPTMARVHRLLLGRLGPPPITATLLDTPYGFQENADEITARAVEYFRENVGMPMTPARLRSADADPLGRATALARLREARYVFAGPGSPSYALRQWQGSGLAELLVDKLAQGGVVVFASAAALTLGAFTVPVYEVYKVGEAPRWLPGLDVLGRLGLPVAVIPHYDNAEGGSHDTRFCYLGERRLALLERDLPESHFVLGVDSHTALLLDLGAGTASIMGLGTVTVRARGRSEVFEPGTAVPLAELGAAAERARTDGSRRPVSPPNGEMGSSTVAGGTTGTTGASGATGTTGTTGTAGSTEAARSPLLDDVHNLAVVFEGAVGSRDVPAAVRTVLALENLLVAWSRDTAGTDEIDRARSTLQASIVRLGELAREVPSASPRPSAALVDLLLELRASARAARDYALGDRIRDALLAEGIELHDGPEGTTWGIRPGG